MTKESLDEIAKLMSDEGGDLMATRINERGEEVTEFVRMSKLTKVSLEELESLGQQEVA